ncbi:MAG TPA: hypothetical protein VM823_01640 [Gaiellales bacterium]|nr:hypothetical protein [Gaiellales bacterium]
MDTGSSLFASVIEDHLELKRRNARLDKDLPLNEFSGSDPFENHPLFKTEDEARREEEETGEHPAIELPADTAEIPVVAAVEVEAHVVPGWMDTTASQEFSWD